LPGGLDSVYILDQGTPPDDDAAYTAEFYFVKDGDVVGPYTGSSFPDDDDANTLEEGEYNYNNEKGHSGGKRKGLNIVNDDGERVATPIGEESNEDDMTLVNVHDSYNSNSRWSEGCPTVPHGDPDRFFDNFDWSGTYNGNTGTTGNSTGTLLLKRGQSAELQKNQLKRALQQQSPMHPSNASMGIVPDSWIQ